MREGCCGGSIHLQNHNSSVGADRRVPRTESQASAAEPSLHSASLASLCSSKRVAALPFPATPAALTDLRSCLSWQVSATNMSDKACQLGDNELAAYIFNHYNWKFDFLRLTVQEIVDEYLRVHVRGGNTGPDFQHQCP